MSNTHATFKEGMTERDLVRELLESALWDIDYHEQNLVQSAAQTAAAKVLLVRCGCSFTVEQAVQFYEDDEDGNDVIRIDDIIKHTIGRLVHGSQYHESSLVSAHRDYAAVVVLIQRMGLDVDQLREEIEAERKKRTEKKKS